MPNHGIIWKMKYVIDGKEIKFTEIKDGVFAAWLGKYTLLVENVGDWVTGPIWEAKWNGIKSDWKQSPEEALDDFVLKAGDLSKHLLENEKMPVNYEIEFLVHDGEKWVVEK